MGNIYHKDLTGTDLHIPKIHQINDTAAHTGTPAAVTGDIVVFDANGLPADSGNVLPNGTTATTQAAGDNSTKVATTAYIDRGSGSAYVLLGSAVPSNATNVTFTGLAGASYSAYKIIINNIVPIVNAANLCLRISTGSGFLAANYRHGAWRWTATASGVGGNVADVCWVVSSASETLGTGVNQTASFEVTIYDANVTSPLKRAQWSASGLWASSTYVYLQGGGQVDTQSAAIDGIRIYCDNGNIASGNIYLYGLRNS